MTNNRRAFYAVNWRTNHFISSLSDRWSFWFDSHFAFQDWDWCHYSLMFMSFIFDDKLTFYACGQNSKYSGKLSNSPSLSCRRLWRFAVYFRLSAWRQDDVDDVDDAWRHCSSDSSESSPLHSLPRRSFLVRTCRRLDAQPASCKLTVAQNPPVSQPHS